MAIEYKTDGGVLLKDASNEANTVVATWVVGNNQVVLQSGHFSIQISKVQLEELIAIGPEIVKDLGMVPRTTRKQK